MLGGNCSGGDLPRVHAVRVVARKYDAKKITNCESQHLRGNKCMRVWLNRLALDALGAFSGWVLSETLPLSGVQSFLKFAL